MEGKELSLQLIQADYDRILDKYHFCENDLDSIKKVGEYILQIAKPVLFYEYTFNWRILCTGFYQNRTEIPQKMHPRKTQEIRRKPAVRITTNNAAPSRSNHSNKEPL